MQLLAQQMLPEIVAIVMHQSSGNKFCEIIDLNNVIVVWHLPTHCRHIKKDIKEHYYVDIDEKTNEQELEFLNFQHYDYDQNLMLDGLEILMELNHNAEHVSEQVVCIDILSVPTCTLTREIVHTFRTCSVNYCQFILQFLIELTFFVYFVLNYLFSFFFFFGPSLTE